MIDRSYPKSVRLRTRRQYLRMGHKASKFTGQWLMADICATTHQSSRLGITVTKKFGTAPQRNRFKRLAREAFRLTRSQIPSSFDIVLRPRSRALEASLTDIQNELMEFIKNATR